MIMARWKAFGGHCLTGSRCLNVQKAVHPLTGLRTVGLSLLILTGLLGSLPLAGNCHSPASLPESNAASSNLENKGPIDTALKPRPNASHAPLASPSGDATPYTLAAGDEIMIEDANNGKLTTNPIRITADGSVDLPLVGSVTLASLSLEEAQALLNRQYQTYYLNPVITVQLLNQHPLRVYIKGAVNTPGVYISGKSTQPDVLGPSVLGESDRLQTFYQFYLTDALLQAGGLKHNANLRDIRIHRTVPHTQSITVNLWELLKKGATLQDVPLQEQDIIEVPSLPVNALVQDIDQDRGEHPEWKTLTQSNIGIGHFQVNVIGAVKKPGTYPITSKDGVLSAIAQAGGFSEEANPKKLFVLRTNASGQVFKKQLDASDSSLTGKVHAQTPSIALLPDDVIFVDNASHKKVLKFGRTLIDRATGPAILPLFSELLRGP